jgi:serine/threonine protein phosphatase PrpC
MTNRMSDDEARPNVPGGPVGLWYSAAASACGVQHPANEDSYLDMAELGLWVVADGMGGHEDGGVASNAIVETLRRLAVTTDSLGEMVALVEEGLHRVNTALWHEGARRERPTIIGSTVVALLAHGGHAAYLWAGDSRAYLRRGQSLYRLTRDHSLMQQMIDRQGLDEAKAQRLYGPSNVITRAIGSGDSLEIDRGVVALADDDLFLLCSDGLTKVIDEAVLLELTEGEDLDTMAPHIVDCAIAAGARDDVTVLLARRIAAA